MNDYNYQRESNLDILLLGGLGIFSAIGLAIASYPAVAQQTTFPDVSKDYWASPFIENLAAKGIVRGYPDGSFRPQQSVDRDEFAAIIRQAFDRKKVRNINSGSTFADVPDGYWAANSIEEAYESGFMEALNNNQFRPREELSKVEALVALTEGLNLTYQPTRTTTPINSNQTKLRAKNSLAFPLASTFLMQPFAQVIAKTPPPAVQNTKAASNLTKNTAPSDEELIKSYYQDAEQIPKNAIANVAAATKANIVVNYPQKRLLQPNQPLTRGGAAALIYQSLVYRGQLSQLDPQAKATAYIVTSGTSTSQK